MDLRKEYDLVCVGAGIMSATLALLVKQLKPDLKVLIVERLDKVAQESSAAWNNAGTGHSALCELNYTPADKNGDVNITKAIDICTQFEISKQYWSYLVDQGLIKEPRSFINPVPHYSWVRGKENTDYLEKRYKALKEHFMFNTITFTRDVNKMENWFPLMMRGRTNEEIMAASRIDRGTEMNYGALTEQLFAILEKEYNTKVLFNTEVEDIDPDHDEDWLFKMENLKNGKKSTLDAQHVFIGAGGGSLLLLQKVEIEEKDGYGGFPVSGEWLVCKNREIIEQHNAKVYSKAGIGDPPMSVPHLDTRYINGKRELLFGPFAGFSHKFLKEGSNLDLLKSINFDNIPSMWGVFWHNLPLTKYLIEQVAMSFEDRMESLRTFIKDAKNEDWEILVAGQRVQTIKKDEFEGGSLEFGTQLVSSKDGKVTCLLGASPGASTSVKIMLNVLEKAFPEIMTTDKGTQLLKKMVPFYTQEVTKNLFDTCLQRSNEILGLNRDLVKE